MNKKKKQINELEDLVAQLNADKSYFEQELIEMQMKQDEMIEELKKKDQEIFEIQTTNDEVTISFNTQESHIRDLESGTCHLI